MNHQNLSSFIWSVADLLRGDYKQSEYGKVVLPFTVLRRLDCTLADSKMAVLKEFRNKQKQGINPDPFLIRASGQSFYNTSELDLTKLMGDQEHIRENLYEYINHFSPAVRDIFERFDFHSQVERLSKAGLLYLITEKFTSINLHPNTVDNMQMGLVFEELIRKFAEISNETAGEHFTPREVIRLMVNLLFIEDNDVLTAGNAVVRTLYDPTAGTGGMLSVAGEYLHEHNPSARLTLFGQELNDESYAICKADMLIKGQDIANLIAGNTLSEDGHNQRKFDYMLSNPPFGVEWKKVEKEVRKEYLEKGFDGRFGPGLPRISDGSMLFLLHLVHKMRLAVDGGSRIGIVLNGSPLFTGAAGSGESEIRRYLFESDLIEAIIGLPTDMFYNTGISTYIWILSNKKEAARKGLVQLIDASRFGAKMRKSLGSKRKELPEYYIAEVTRLFGDFQEADLISVCNKTTNQEMIHHLVGRETTTPKAKNPLNDVIKRYPVSRLFKNESFGYTTITVERPLRDERGEMVLATKGKQKGAPQPDPELRDTENVPLDEDVQTYFEREVLPHAPDAWIDHSKTKIGYEIPFTRHFYVFEPLRELSEIDAELSETTEKFLKMIQEFTMNQEDTSIKPISCEISTARKLENLFNKRLACLNRIEISNVIYHEIGAKLYNRQKAFADLDPATDGNIYQFFCYLQKEMADTIFNNFITIIGSVDSKTQELKAWKDYGISPESANKLRAIRARYAHIRNNLISHINDIPEKEILKDIDEISQEQVKIDAQTIREVLNEARTNQGLLPIHAMWSAEKQYPVQGLKNLFELLESEKNEI